MVQQRRADTSTCAAGFRVEPSELHTLRLLPKDRPADRPLLERQLQLAPRGPKRPRASRGGCRCSPPDGYQLSKGMRTARTPGGLGGGYSSSALVRDINVRRRRTTPHLDAGDQQPQRHEHRADGERNLEGGLVGLEQLAYADEDTNDATEDGH